MKVLILNSSDSVGGAAKAAFRMYEALLQNGVDVKMLVHEKVTTNPDIGTVTNKFIRILQTRWDKYELKLRRYLPLSFFSIGRVGNNIINTKWFIEADVILVHWFNRGFLSIQDIEQIAHSGKKIIWTLHDSWAFTGGCHLPYACELYLSHCGTCPALQSHKQQDLSYSIFETKLNHWNRLPLQVLTPSGWLAQKAAASTILKSYPIRVFPNALNTDVFKPKDREAVRKKYQLPLHKKVILFGAVGAMADSNKGYDLLLKAIEKLIKQNSDFAKEHVLCVFGSSAKIELPMETFTLGNIKHETDMADVYAAADVFVTPSKSENLPYTVMESLACGTPVVAFKIGGIPEMVTHLTNGYLATPYDVEDFAAGIETILKTIASGNEAIGLDIRNRYGYQKVANEMMELCKHIS